MDFHNKLDYYAQQGYRIIAIAYKSLDKKMTYAKVQRIARDHIECYLSFVGLVILENRLKPDTTSIINNLSAAHIRTIMVTGDNILTALSVARDCNMIKGDQNVVIVSAKQKQDGSNEWELLYNASGKANSNEIRANGVNNYTEEKANQTSNNYLLLTRNSNSAASLDTIDTYTQSTQITHEEVELQNVSGLDANKNQNNSHCTQIKIITEYMNNNYRFAMDGKTWSVINDQFSDLLDKFLTRGTVYARMSPDQKQALILELQSLGYYVAMCGDGANDCGALKAAHTGISLSEAESSVASPFTSKKPTIACVPDVIREGRCALVTSVAIFKYMAAYSLIQFASVLILYSIDSNLTDIQFLYIDLFMISIFAFFFGKTESYDGPLVKETPLNSLLSIAPIASLIIHLTLAIGFQMIGWFYLRSQTWFEPFVYKNTRAYDHGCYENYTIFVISCFQYIILAVVFSKGAPYRKPIISNYGFLISLVGNFICTIVIAMAVFSFLTEKFQLIVPADVQFRWKLIGFGLCNFVLSFLVEVFVIEYFIFQKLRYRFHNVAKSHRKYLLIENSLSQMPDWPPFNNKYKEQTKGNDFADSDYLNSFHKNNIVLKAHYNNCQESSDDDSISSDTLGSISNREQSEITLNPILLAKHKEKLNSIAIDPNTSNNIPPACRQHLTNGISDNPHLHRNE